jgi:hypothetical protein
MQSDINDLETIRGIAHRKVYDLRETFVFCAIPHSTERSRTSDRVARRSRCLMGSPPTKRVWRARGAAGPTWMYHPRLVVRISSRTYPCNAVRTAHGFHFHVHRSAVRYFVAEIPITRKNRRNLWPMLLGLLALVLVLGFLFGKRRVTKPGLASDTTSATTSATSTGAVADSARPPR